MRVPKSRVILADQEDQAREVEFRDEVHLSLNRKQKILEDPDKVRTLRDKLLLRAREARTDFPSFFNFVSVNEHTRERMTMAAHQRVFMDFVEKHDRAVVMLPIGHAKTISSAWFATYLLGVDPTTRGAIVSNTQDQASKPLAMVRQYIETSARLRLVFPKLQRSRREGDPWTQTKLTIDRPMGIRDASLMAVGYQGAIEGSRLNFILVDDILDPENTNTKEQRDKLYEWIRISVLSRLDPRGSRFVFTNTPYHPEDAAHQLKKIGWPTIIMRLSGDVEISTPAQEVAPNVWTEDRWGIDDAIAHELRPKSPGSPICRLTAHDPDPTNGQTLWPERIPPEMIPRLKREYGTIVFNKVFEMEVRDDSTSMVKREWIEACKKKAREAGIHKFRDRYNHDILYAPTFTGVDLAVKKSDSADDTCFFTFAVLPTGDLLILDIDIGKLNGPEIINKIVEKHERYGSIITVESNACFVPGTKVLTKRGYVPIETVAVGDEVWTHAKRWRPVTKVITGTSKTTTTARGKGGLDITCSPNHWFHMKEACRTPGRAGGHTRPHGEARWVSVGFTDRPAYVELAVPKWPAIDPVVHTRASRYTEERDVKVTPELAMLFGLYMAEGNASNGIVSWTFARKETHLSDFVRDVLFHVLSPCTKAGVCFGEGTRRVQAYSWSLADLFRTIGKKAKKTLPLEWLGWPLHLRLKAVRGWFMGDGCLKKNSGNTILVGDSISRDWILWARATLLEAGYRPSISIADRKTSTFKDGRVVTCQPIYTLALSTNETAHFMEDVSEIEDRHWSRYGFSYGGVQKTPSPIVHDDDGTWCTLKVHTPGEFDAYGGPVWNLEVEEDHSYTVEDYIVHNAQSFIAQFALDRNIAIPVREYMTTTTKNSIWHGVPQMFVLLENNAWLIPNMPDGTMHPNMERWVNGCLYYTPSDHTDDSVMASWMAYEEARRSGFLSKIGREHMDQGDGRRIDPIAAATGGLLSR